MEPSLLDGKVRKDIRPGLTVGIVLKQDQRKGRLTARPEIRRVLEVTAGGLSRSHVYDLDPVIR